MGLIVGGLPRLSSKKPSSIQIDRFNGGVNVLLSETRLNKNEAKQATNLLLIEDGIWDKRWGTKTKITMGSNVDGFTEYVDSSGSTQLIICAGGTIYKSTDLSTTSALSGATYTAGNRCYFVQLGSFLYIGSGVDALIRYNGSTLAQYTALSNPGAVTLTRGSGLSAGSYTYYYKVTASNAIGETSPSAEASITVNKNRNNWASATTEYIQLDWAAVTGAIYYTVYFSDASGYETKLTTISANTFQDTGSLVANTYIETPNANSTGGPKLSHMWISGNRIWGADPNNLYRVWFSGGGVYLGNFSTAFGGGWIELEKGGRATVVGGIDFQGKSHIFCKTPDGRGNIWQVVLESQTVSGTTTSYIVPVPTKIVGMTSTQSPRSIIAVENDAWFANIKSVNILGNEPGVLNVLRTNELSAKIRPYIQALAAGSISKICAYYYDAKVFLSVPSASGDPDRTIVFDRERLAWIKDWSIGFTQFGEFTTPSDSKTHFLGSSSTKIKEISSSYQDDDGTAFSWSYVSGRIPMSPDWTRFAKIKRAYIKLRNTTGSVSFSTTGTGKIQSLSTLATGTITPTSSDTGMGWDQVGSFQVGSTNGVPTSFSDESLIRYLRVNKLIRDIQWTISGTGISDRAVITGLLARGYPVTTGDPSDWRL